MPLPSLPLPGMEPQKLRRCDIKRIVQERLQGFRVRQMERVEIRRKRRRKYESPDERQQYFDALAEFREIDAVKDKCPRVKGDPIVKCPIVFRASFKGARGPMRVGFEYRGEYEIEAYQARVGNPPPSEWKARHPTTKVDYKGITPQTTFPILQRQIGGVCFETCTRDWEAFDSRQSPIRKLKSDEWELDKEGIPFLTEHYLDVLKAEEVNRRDAQIAARKAKALEGM
jgi:hypothetical protein